MSLEQVHRWSYVTLSVNVCDFINMLSLNPKPILPRNGNFIAANDRKLQGPKINWAILDIIIPDTRVQTDRFLQLLQVILVHAGVICMGLIEPWPQYCHLK